ncbi:MAG: heavy-metal-associated domain-containing protein [Planctomycetes bacterium]|nr:heavy-metal-associated domain-containing protein [Planctomycetota bacterium]
MTGRTRRAAAGGAPAVGRITWAAAVLAAAGLGALGTGAPALPGRYDEVDLVVGGLSCGLWCPLQLDHALARIEGVHQVVVDVARGRVQVSYDPRRVEPAALARRVDALEGYRCEGPREVRAVVRWDGEPWSVVAPSDAKGGVLLLRAPGPRREAVEVTVRPVEPVASGGAWRQTGTWTADAPELRLPLGLEALGPIEVTLTRRGSSCSLTIPARERGAAGVKSQGGP